MAGEGEGDVALLQAIFEKLEPTQEAYTHPLTTPLEKCFHWNSVVQLLMDAGAGDTKLYGVAFKSLRKAGVEDDTLLYAADAEAFGEAMESSQLIRYWYGVLNGRRECLATCIWRSPEAAKSAMILPLHMKAASLAPHFYERYTLERYWLHFTPNGSFHIHVFSTTPSS
eukprot:Gb_15280 [translate_table: standard]